MTTSISGANANSFATPAAATPAAAPSATSTTATDQAGLDKTYSQFLTLLTTQLKNQDPMAPMDSSQFTQQLVSFSQVEQQLKSNASLSQLVSSAAANQAAQSVYYIGLHVNTPGGAISYGGKGSVQMSYTLPATSSNTQISILDKNNNAVYSTTGSTAAGNNTFTWNGLDNNGNQVAAGNYTLSVGALDAANKTMTVTTSVPGLVTGVQTASGGSTDLIVNGQPVPLSSVTTVTN